MMMMIMMMVMMMMKVPLNPLQVPVCPQQGWEGANWERWEGGEGLPASRPHLPGWGHAATPGRGQGCPRWPWVRAGLRPRFPAPGFLSRPRFHGPGLNSRKALPHPCRGARDANTGGASALVPVPPLQNLPRLGDSGARQGWGGCDTWTSPKSQYGPRIIPNAAPKPPSGFGGPLVVQGVTLCPLPSVPHWCHPRGHSSRPPHSGPGVS